FINDHDRMVMEYGLFPFEKIIKKRVELNSINKGGADNYLNAINKAREKHRDLILIPGSETVPFYYWKGSYFKKDLTAHDHEKRILIMGLEKPEDYKNLPILHNGFSTRYARDFLPKILVFLGAFILGIVLISDKGISRISGIIVSLLSLLLLINTYPFRSSPFDQYSGNQGIAPYQLLIDYVNSKGGLAFWNYPETGSGVRKLGPIFVNTPPYPEALEQAMDYTGFSALYGDTITATEPGHEWDSVLLAFCRGERKRPVWGISTADFHKDGVDGQKLGDFPTVFLVRNRTQEDILAAMQAGRMYACSGTYPQRIVLNEFSVCSAECETKATLGEEIRLKNNPKIHISLALKISADNGVNVRLIRSGELIKTFSGSLPMDIDFEDKYFEPGETIYYRIDVTGPGALVSNPIFVTFEE
ncbi:MAG: hypothetical protein KKH68_08720, partial [Proteobacteria bacterium]|nr:hypothetical protein [Pseudomonadota bacterium]